MPPEDNDTKADETDDETTPPAGDDDDGLDDAAKAALRKKNQENASLRRRLREAEAKAKKLDELEDAQKSEQQKLADRIKALEGEVRQVSTERDRLKVALSKGLTETQAKRLVGDTVEELEADADDLLATFKPSNDDDENGGDPKPPAPTGRPKENLKGGGKPSEEPAPDLRQVVESIPRSGI